jgi:hypothetical protein
VIALDAPLIHTVVEAQSVDSGRVQDPHCAAPVLNANRTIGNQVVEPLPVKLARHRLVIADAADPFSGATVARKGLTQRPLVPNLRRTTADGSVRGGLCEQMDMMILEARQQRTASRVQ